MYLVRDTNPEPSAPREFALKKVSNPSSLNPFTLHAITFTSQSVPVAISTNHHHHRNQVLAGSSDALDEARKEIEVMQKIRHPHLLPLLAYSIKELVDAPEAAATHVIYLLFPLYTVGVVLCGVFC